MQATTVTTTRPRPQTTAELQAQIAKLSAENSALSNKIATMPKAKALTINISEKTGCISVGGMGRYPTSLYMDQWLRLIAFTPTISQFIEDNKEQLKGRE